MLRISICDDMPDELQRLAAPTRQYLSSDSLDAEVTGSPIRTRC